MKILVAFLAAFFFNVATAATKVVFLNGIKGTEEGRRLAREKIKIVLSDAGILTKFESASVEFTYWTNPGNGFEDFLELRVQALNSSAAFSSLKLFPTGELIDNTAQYRASLGRIYSNKIAASNTINSVDELHVNSVVDQLSKAVSDEVFNKNNSIIVVAHLQGNYFAEAIDTLTDKKLNGEDVKTFSLRAEQPAILYWCGREESVTSY